MIRARLCVCVYIGVGLRAAAVYGRCGIFLLYGFSGYSG